MACVYEYDRNSRAWLLVTDECPTAKGGGCPPGSVITDPPGPGDEEKFLVTCDELSRNGGHLPTIEKKDANGDVKKYIDRSKVTPLPKKS